MATTRTPPGLPPGRLLDRVVAARALGYTVARDPAGPAGWLLLDGDGAPVARATSAAGAWRHAPACSGDIAAAWRVVAALHRRYYDANLHLVAYTYGRAYAAFCLRPDDEDYREGGGAQPVAHAICRAALAFLDARAAGADAATAADAAALSPRAALRAALLAALREGGPRTIDELCRATGATRYGVGSQLTHLRA